MDRKPYVLTQFDVKRLEKHRASCTACNGDANACMAGDTHQNRLQGCVAFTDEGMVAPLNPTVRQPWETREAA